MFHRQLVLALIIAVCGTYFATGKSQSTLLIRHHSRSVVVFSVADPSPPVWPVAFQENFVETSILPGAGTGNNIKGTYYYDFDKKAV
jgi:hypothetical protein